MRRIAFISLFVTIGCTSVQDPGAAAGVEPGVAASTPTPAAPSAASPGTPPSVGGKPEPVLPRVDPNAASSRHTVPLAIVTPRAGDRPWARGSVHSVVWEGTDLPPVNAAVATSIDAGVTWQYVAQADIDTEGRRAWVTVPEQGSELRLRVRIGTKVLEAGPVAINSQSFAKSYTFEKVASSLPFGPRDGMAGVVFQGKMYGLGGWNPGVFPSDSANDIWTSLDGATWTQAKPNTFLVSDDFNDTNDWTGRHFFGLTVHEGAIYMVGSDPLHGLARDVWKSTDGATWQNLTRESAYPARVFQYTVSFGALWVMGGEDGDRHFNDVWRSQDGVTWTKIPTQGPMWSPRGLIGGEAVWGDRIWIIGGGTYQAYLSGDVKAEGTDFNDVWSTADGITWRRDLEYLPFPSRHYHNVTVYDGRMWVLGGHNVDHGNLADAFYSTDGYNWYRQAVPPTLLPRHAGTTWVHAGALFWGSGNAFDDDNVWRAEMWKLTPTPPPP